MENADPQLPLIIDPILQSTYLGGSGDDWAYALAIGSSGEVYVAGRTTSTNFPNTTGGAQGTSGGDTHAFVARLNSALTSNPQSTYLEGSGNDWAWALAIGSSGEVYVGGETGSLDFPNTSGGAQGAPGGARDAFVARLSAGLAGVLIADMQANVPSVPSALAPGGSYPVTFSCTNTGPDPATNATCSLTATSGTVSGVSCTPAVPVASLAAGASITCSATYTAPGTPGGSDTTQTGVTFTVTAGTTSTDPNSSNNSATKAGGPVPIVDAIHDAVSLPGGGIGSYPVGAKDQMGTGSPPSGSSFTYLGGTCTGASVNPTTGVASFQVPLSGSCTVNYQLCFSQACDTAPLTVTAAAVLQAIPTLGGWGLVVLVVSLGAVGGWILRRLRA